MISYEDFKKEVTENFLSYLPEEYQNMQVIVRSTEKINRTRDALLLDARDIDPNILSELVYSVNVTEVDVGERLSNNVYYYDKDMRKLSQATDNTNISLSQEKIKFMYDNPSL